MPSAATVAQPSPPINGGVAIVIDVTAPQPPPACSSASHPHCTHTQPCSKESQPPDPLRQATSLYSLCTECPICFDSFEQSPIFKCGHSVCESCLTGYLSYKVLSEDEAFPTCPLPFCTTVFRNALLRRYLDPAVTSHLWELQAQQQARSIDGTKLFCGCATDNNSAVPLPPPEPLPGHVAPVTTCPECASEVCVQCGLSSHLGGECKVPLATKRFDVPTSLYLMYAVGRVGICPECNQHVERNGGCQVVTCRCGHEFNFRAFKSMQDVAISLENHKKTPTGIIISAAAVCTLLLALSVGLFFVLPTKMATIVAMSIILIVLCIACFCCGVRWTS